jgi:hypothetical protein
MGGLGHQGQNHEVIGTNKPRDGILTLKSLPVHLVGRHFCAENRSKHVYEGG